MKNNKLYFIFPALLFIFYLLIQIKYHYFTIDHISWINAFDGDISYQVDRLLLNSRFPNYSQISSTSVDYGVELFLLAPVLKITNFFTHYDPLYSYYIITTTHLITGFAAIFLLSTFFENNNLEKILWFTILLFSPLFGFHLSYIKPDPNIVFLLVTLSLYYTSKIKLDLKYAVYALFFAAFGFAIKWWGLFCLLPVFYYMYSFQDLNPGFYKKMAKKASIISMVLLIPISHFLLSEILDIFLKNNVHNVLTNHSPFLIKLILLLSGSLFIFACYILLQKLIKISKILAIILFEAMIFTASYLAMALPFMTSGFYLRSFWSYSVGELKIDKIGTNERRSMLDNIGFWISEFRDYHYFSPILLIAFIGTVAFFVWKKKVVLNDQLKSTAFYLTGITFFIFLILTRNNRALIAMLYPFYLFVIFYLFSKLRASKIKMMALIALSAIQIFYQSNAKGGNLATIYFERVPLRANVIDANIWLEKTFPHIRNFYMSDYAFPESTTSPFKFHYKWRYYYKENLEKDLLNQSDTDAWIIATEMLNKYTQTHPDLLKNKKVTKYSHQFTLERNDFSIVENKH